MPAQVCGGHDGLDEGADDEHAGAEEEEGVECDAVECGAKGDDGECGGAAGSQEFGDEEVEEECGGALDFVKGASADVVEVVPEQDGFFHAAEDGACREGEEEVGGGVQDELVSAELGVDGVCADGQGKAEDDGDGPAEQVAEKERVWPFECFLCVSSCNGAHGRSMRRNV